MKKVLFILSLFIALHAQTQTPCACCTESHQQFDFWEGDWIVLDTAGNKLGENTISKEEQNCILKEKWRGTQGGTGTSTNYYNSTDSTWNQLWISSNGNVLKLRGGLENGNMVLKSELIPGQRVDFYYNQITWTPNEDGTVTQRWDVCDKEGNILSTLFLGIYHRKEEKSEG